MFNEGGASLGVLTSKKKNNFSQNILIYLSLKTWLGSSPQHFHLYGKIINVCDLCFFSTLSLRVSTKCFLIGLDQLAHQMLFSYKS